MESKIIIFSTSPLHQVGCSSSCCCQLQHGVQDHHLLNQPSPSGWLLIQLLLSTTTWSPRSSSSQPALSIRLVAHPAVVVNYNMESKIIIFSTSPLHQVGCSSSCCCQLQHGVQDHHLLNQPSPSGWLLIQLLLSTTTWSPRSSSSQPALSIRLVAHPAVVVNINMEYKIIIFPTSSLHQVGRPSSCCCQHQHGVQDHHLPNQLSPSGWSPIQLLLSTSTWSTRSSSSQPALSIRQSLWRFFPKSLNSLFKI